MAAITIFNQGKQVLTYRILRAETRVGTGALNDLVIPGEGVCKYHFVIRRGGAGCRISDRSGSGVNLNGGRVKEADLKDGDEIVFGGITARFAAFEAGGKGDGVSGLNQVELTEVIPETSGGAGILGKAFLQIPGSSDGRIELVGDVTNIGSAEGNQVRLQEKYISAFHCRIHRQAGMFRIADLGSTNGTFVNDAKVVDSILPNGARIVLGKTELRFSLVAEDTDTPLFQGMTGASRPMRDVFELIGKIAQTDATVLITGETGTGKELVARAVHNLSGRAAGPFIPINCAAISKDVLESELFGHEKGAFTGAVAMRRGAFEEAEGGTLFIDEVGELSPDIQTKILRAVEYGEIKRVGANRPMRVSTRILAATNRDLPVEVRAGRFREDLYYRLSVIPIRLPPLRERPGDVSIIARRMVAEMSGGARLLSQEAVEKLESYIWPGNVRELKNVITRAIVLSDSTQLGPGELEFTPALLSDYVESGQAFAGGKTLAEIEKVVIISELDRQDGHREKTAKALGIGLSTLKDKLRAWGMTGKKDEV